jgi:hypothetical protein
MVPATASAIRLLSLYVPPPGAAAAAERLLWPPPDPDRDEALAFTQSLRAFIEPAWPIVEPGTVVQDQLAHRRDLRAPRSGLARRDPRADHQRAAAAHEVLADRRALAVLGVADQARDQVAVRVLRRRPVEARQPEVPADHRVRGRPHHRRDAARARRLPGRPALLGQNWQLASDQNEKMRFENTEAGYRIATSVGGTATGEGGDILVVDDPHKADEVESETERATSSTFSTARSRPA